MAEKSTIDRINGLAEEAVTLWSNTYGGGLTLKEQWEDDGRRFLGDQWGARGSSFGGLVDGKEGSRVNDGQDATSLIKPQRVVINRTQNAVIATTAVKLRKRPTVRLTPAESSDDPQYIIKRSRGMEMLKLALIDPQVDAQVASQVAFARDPAMLPPLQEAVAAGQIDVTKTPFTSYQLSGVAPMTRPQVDAIAALNLGIVWVWFTLPQMLGDEPFEKFEADTLLGVVNPVLPPLLLDDDVYIINDHLVADIADKIFKNRVSLAGLDFYIAQNDINCSIFGHQPMLFEWDPVKHIPVFGNPHILNVYIDPLCTGRMEDAAYIGVDVPISAEKSKLLWPKYAAKIDEAANTGQLTDKEGNTVHGAEHGYDFRRMMLTVRTFWERYVPYPSTPQQAMEAGVVEPTERGGIMHLAGTDKPIGLDDPNWPTTPGIRQTQTIPAIGVVLSDQPCPFADMPWAWNLNIPIQYTPYGQGEPMRMADVQTQINRLASILHNHARYYQYPMMIVPLELMELMKAKGLRDIFARPGRMIGVPRHIWQTAVNSPLARQGFTMTPPPIPGEFVKLLEMLLTEIDRSGGYVDVLQGQAPAKDTSGIAITQLQNAAHGPIALKSMYTEWMLERIARLTLDAIVKWLPTSVWMKILDQYPESVVELVRQKIDPEQFNIEVEIMSGKGANRELEQQRMERLYAGGAVGRLAHRRMAMEAFEIPDPARTEREIDKDDRKAMELAAAGAALQEPDNGTDRKAAG